MRPPAIPPSTIPTWVTQQPSYQQSMYAASAASGHYPQHSMQQQQHIPRPLNMPPAGIKPYPNATAPVLLNPNYASNVHARPMSQQMMSQQHMARPQMSQQQMSHALMGGGQMGGQQQQMQMQSAPSYGTSQAQQPPQRCACVSC